MAIVQNEIGGKDLLLKTLIAKTAATTNLSNDVVITSHGAKIGDIISFNSVGLLTSFQVGIFYYVKAVIDANILELSLNKSSLAIVADATTSALSVNLFSAVGGVRSKSKSFSSSAIDITNEDSNEWKKTLDAAGIRALSMSVDGVVTNSVNYTAIEDDAHNNALHSLLFINTKLGKLVSCLFKITSLEQAAPYDGEATFTASFESAGEPTFFNMGV